MAQHNHVPGKEGRTMCVVKSVREYVETFRGAGLRVVSLFAGGDNCVGNLLSVLQEEKRGGGGGAVEPASDWLLLEYASTAEPACYWLLL